MQYVHGRHCMVVPLGCPDAGQQAAASADAGCSCHSLHGICSNASAATPASIRASSTAEAVRALPVGPAAAAMLSSRFSSVSSNTCSWSVQQRCTIHHRLYSCSSAARADAEQHPSERKTVCEEGMLEPCGDAVVADPARSAETAAVPGQLLVHLQELGLGYPAAAALQRVRGPPGCLIAGSIQCRSGY